MDPLDPPVHPSKKTRVQAGIMQFVGPVNSNVTSEHVPYQSDPADTVSQHPERFGTDTVQQYVAWLRIELKLWCFMQSHLDRTPTTEDILNEFASASAGLRLWRSWCTEKHEAPLQILKLQKKSIST